MDIFINIKMCKTFLLLILMNTSVVVISAAPTGTLYNEIHNEANKCPYLQSTKLINPEPEFLKQCTDFNRMKLLRFINEDTVSDARCLLYYNSFLLLCYSGNSNLTLTNNLNAETVNKTYKMSTVDNVCKVLRNISYTTNPIHEPMGTVLQYIKGVNKCERLCTDMNLKVLPVCNGAAYMIDLQNLNQQNGRNIITSKDAAAKISGDSSNGEEQSQINLDKDSSKKLGKPGESPNISHLQEDLFKNPSSSQKRKLVPKLLKPMSSNQAAQHGSLPTLEVKLPKHVENELSKQVEKELPIQKENGKEHLTQNTQSKEEKGQQLNNVTANTVKSQDGESLNKNAGVQANINSPNQEDVGKKTHDNVQPQEVMDASNMDNTKDHVDDEAPKQPASEQSAPKEPAPKEPVPKEPAPKEPTPKQPETKQPAPNVDQNTNPIEPSEPVGIEDKYSSMDYKGEDEGDILDPQEGPYEKESKPKPFIKPVETDEDEVRPVNYNNQSREDDDSFFFTYFMMICAVFILGYIGYHNKQKVFALVLEGRRGRRTSRTRRPNSANYHKLDSNLEEAVTSSCNKNTTSIIY